MLAKWQAIRSLESRSKRGLSERRRYPSSTFGGGVAASFFAAMQSSEEKKFSKLISIPGKGISKVIDAFLRVIRWFLC